MKIILKTYKLKGSDGYKEEGEVEIENVVGILSNFDRNKEFAVDKQELYKVLKLLM